MGQKLPPLSWLQLVSNSVSVTGWVLSNSSHWLSKAEGAVENSELELFFPEGALSLLTFLLSSSLFSRSLLQKPNREEKPDATLITF